MPGRTSVAAGSATDTDCAADGSSAPRTAGAAPAAEELIAAAALDELPSRGTVLLDAGPVAEELARSLPAGGDLTVITNSMPVAMALIVREDVTVLLIGGRIQSGAGATVGGHGTAGPEDLQVDVAFITADGVSAERGLTTRAPVESAAKRMMLRAADRVVVLAPSERIGHVELARFGALAEVDCLITDSPCDTPAGRRVGVGVQRLTRV
ncbi:DeoR family transcriptional regulator [Streptomonospora arabica]|uniref:DeoR family transcriptional regulator n=1 Tax=Streptomonospora arabica TaxID=412417 RepID=A0ABV9SU99_9ACTN